MPVKRRITPQSTLIRGLTATAIALVSALSPLSSALGDQGHGQSGQSTTSATPATPPHGTNGMHGHRTLEIPSGQPIPTVTLIAHADPVRGWNLEIQTTNFRFSPEHVNQPHQPNEGHAHLYINGEYVSRVYGPWLHLPALPQGHHEITVVLNTNSHETLTHNGQAIEDRVMVDVP